MRLREELLGFLLFRQNVDFCDRCLADHLGAPLDALTATARDLARSPAVLRDLWVCHTCRRRGPVTRALSNRAVTARQGVAGRFRRHRVLGPSARAVGA